MWHGRAAAEDGAAHFPGVPGSARLGEPVRIGGAPHGGGAFQFLHRISTKLVEIAFTEQPTEPKVILGAVSFACSFVDLRKGHENPGQQIGADIAERLRAAGIE